MMIFQKKNDDFSKKKSLIGKFKQKIINRYGFLEVFCND